MKGSVFDLFVGSIFIFLIAVVLILVSYFSTAVAEIPAFANNTLVNQTMASAANGINIMDGVMLIIVISLMIGSVVSASMINSRPVYFVISVLMNAACYVINTAFSNVFVGLASNPTFAATANKFLLTTFLMQNLPLISIGIGFVVAIFFYAKGSGGGGY